MNVASSPLPDRALLLADQFVPLLSFVPGWEGLVATAFASHHLAEQAAANRADGPVTISERPTFDAMSHLAGWGATGIWWRDLDVFAKFAVRADEAGHPRPTLAVAVNPAGDFDSDGPIHVITRTGRRQVSPGDLLWWLRYDIIDAGWTRFVDDDEPLVGWTNGSLLYEIVQGRSAERWYGEESVFGPWGSPDGTLAFFTRPVDAAQFERTFVGRVRTMLDDPDDVQAGLRLVEIPDLRSRLAARSHPMPITIAINPGCPRGSAAVVIDGETPQIVTVNARYELLTNNILSFVEEADNWQGHGTLHWSGSSAYTEFGLQRSFCAAPMIGIAADLEELSDVEVTEVVESCLTSTTSTALNGPELECFTVSELFTVVGWDTVNGDRFALNFPSLIEAMKWLVQHERAFDRPSRVSGAQGEWQLGFGGSEDPAGETQRGEALRRVLVRFTAGALKAGYRPESIDDLIALANRVLRGTRLDAMGYVGDLTWRMSAEPGQLEDLSSIEGFAFEFSALQDWLAAVQLEPDRDHLAEVRQRLGAATDLLEPSSRLFLATAMLDRQARGGSPVMDYAPVSVGITKALEVELVALLDGFRRQAQQGLAATANSDRNDTLLADFLHGKRGPSLGEMRHLLKSAPDGIQREWTDYLDGLRDGRELRTSRFREFLHKVAETYRNGGAHNSAIPMATAESCLREVVGEIGEPGWLAKVAFVKASANEHRE